MHRAAFALTAAAVTVPVPVHADFEVIDELVLATSNDQAHGLTFDGERWYVAQIFSPEWDVFDADFAYQSTTEAAAGSSIRGVTFDESTGTILAADYASGRVFEFTTTGELVSSFTAASANQLNAVALHRVDGTIWVATFNQGIRHFDRDGTMIGGFNTPFFITGLAIDEAADTLLIMESTNDFVREFNFNGQMIDVPIPFNLIPDNGQGLAYDPYTATLYATTQTGPSRVTVFQDPERETLDAGPPPCPGDCDADGLYNRLDFICFMTAWRQQEESADCNADGRFDILDFICFQQAFLTQCGEAKAVQRLYNARGIGVVVAKSQSSKHSRWNR